jgi:hypothetical protein
MPLQATPAAMPPVSPLSDFGRQISELNDKPSLHQHKSHVRPGDRGHRGTIADTGNTNALP